MYNVHIQNIRQRSSLLYEGQNFLPRWLFYTRMVWRKRLIVPGWMKKRMNSSYSSNHPGAKSVVRHGSEWIPPSKQQRRPLPFLLSVSSSMSEHIRTFVNCFLAQHNNDASSALIFSSARRTRFLFLSLRFKIWILIVSSWRQFSWTYRPLKR